MEHKYKTVSFQIEQSKKSTNTQKWELELIFQIISNKIET